MPRPLKPLDPGSGVDQWIGAELRHRRIEAGLGQGDLATLIQFSPSLIGKLERGERSLHADVARALDKALGTGGVFARAMPLVNAERDRRVRESDNPLQALALTPGGGSILEHEHHDDAEQDVNRRGLLSGAAGWAAILGAERTRIPGLADLIGTVLGTAAPKDGPVLGLDDLAVGVREAKRDYQNCRYREALHRLPILLAQLNPARYEGAAKDRAAMVAAAAYQVVSGVMLKYSEHTLATLAADRSMTLAAIVGDPLVVASSARAVTHVLLRSGYAEFAADYAAARAADLDAAQTPESAAVHGALLLRGAVAAADAGRRSVAADLLDRADAAAAPFDATDNVQGTGFNQVNVALHRVSIAVILGDAGHAIDLARAIDLAAIDLVERQVSLALDVASAFAQWGRYEQAMDTLYYAESTAPQEVRARAKVGRLLTAIQASAPPSIKPHAREFARRIAA